MRRRLREGGKPAREGKRSEATGPITQWCSRRLDRGWRKLNCMLEILPARARAAGEWDPARPEAIVRQ